MRGQVTIEAIAVLSIILFLFSLVALEAYRRSGEVAGLEEAYRKRVVCGRLADGISEAYGLGPKSRVDASLPYLYNVTIDGSEGIITVGDEPATETCTMPAGAMNHSATFRRLYVNFTNGRGTVEVGGG
jgi:hypothetical protein